MSTEVNKAHVRQFFEEIYDGNNLAVCDEILEAEFAAFEKAWVPTWRTAFPDLTMTVDTLIAEGDQVVAAVTMRGTHTGVLDGDLVNWLTSRLEPTGKQVEINGIFIYRIFNDRLLNAPHHAMGDWLAMLRQLGAVPMPAEVNV